jgi:hypothetical protein
LKIRENCGTGVLKNEPLNYNFPSFEGGVPDQVSFHQLLEFHLGQAGWLINEPTTLARKALCC